MCIHSQISDLATAVAVVSAPVAADGGAAAAVAVVAEDDDDGAAAAKDDISRSRRASASAHSQGSQNPQVCTLVGSQYKKYFKFLDLRVAGTPHLHKTGACGANWGLAMRKVREMRVSPAVGCSAMPFRETLGTACSHASWQSSSMTRHELCGIGTVTLLTGRICSESALEVVAVLRSRRGEGNHQGTGR